jgi:hypothetical protein
MYYTPLSLLPPFALTPSSTLLPSLAPSLSLLPSPSTSPSIRRPIARACKLQSFVKVISYITQSANDPRFQAKKKKLTTPSSMHTAREGVLPSHVLRNQGGKLGLTDDIERRAGKIQESLLRTMLDDGDGGICGCFCAPKESF